MHAVVCGLYCNLMLIICGLLCAADYRINYPERYDFRHEGCGQAVGVSLVWRDKRSPPIRVRYNTALHLELPENSLIEQHLIIQSCCHQHEPTANPQTPCHR